MPKTVENRATKGTVTMPILPHAVKPAPKGARPNGPEAVKALAEIFIIIHAEEPSFRQCPFRQSASWRPFRLRVAFFTDSASTTKSASKKVFTTLPTDITAPLPIPSGGFRKYDMQNY